MSWERVRVRDEREKFTRTKTKVGPRVEKCALVYIFLIFAVARIFLCQRATLTGIRIQSKIPSVSNFVKKHAAAVARVRTHIRINGSICTGVNGGTFTLDDYFSDVVVHYVSWRFFDE